RGVVLTDEGNGRLAGRVAGDAHVARAAGIVDASIGTQPGRGEGFGDGPERLVDAPVPSHRSTRADVEVVIARHHFAGAPRQGPVADLALRTALVVAPAVLRLFVAGGSIAFASGAAR